MILRGIGIVILFIGLGIAAWRLGSAPRPSRMVCIGPGRDVEGGTLRLYLSSAPRDRKYPLIVAAQSEIEVDAFARMIVWPSGRRTVFPPGSGTLLVYRDGRTAWSTTRLPPDEVGRAIPGLSEEKVGDALYRILRSHAQDRLDPKILDFCGR